jgi:hypothetical protein
MSHGSKNTDLEKASAKAQAVKDTYAGELMSKANVVGVGIGFCQKGGLRTDTVGLVVMVSRKLPRAQLAPEDLLPDEIDGIPVDVQEVGEIRAH